MTREAEARAWLVHCIGCGGEHVEYLLDEVERLRAKNRELNRRAQQGESTGRKEFCKELFGGGKPRILYGVLEALGLDIRTTSFADMATKAATECSRLVALETPKCTCCCMACDGEMVCQSCHDGLVGATDAWAAYLSRDL